MKLNEDKFCIKIIELDEICNFVVRYFFIWNNLAQLLVRVKIQFSWTIFKGSCLSELPLKMISIGGWLKKTSTGS